MELNKILNILKLILSIFLLIGIITCIWNDEIDYATLYSIWLIALTFSKK